MVRGVDTDRLRRAWPAIDLAGVLERNKKNLMLRLTQQNGGNDIIASQSRVVNRVILPTHRTTGTLMTSLHCPGLHCTHGDVLAPISQ